MINEKSETTEVLSRKDRVFDSIASNLFKKRSIGGQFLATFFILFVPIAIWYIIKSIVAFIINFLISIAGNTGAYQYREDLTLAVTLIVGMYLLFKMQKAINKAKKESDSTKSKEVLDIENKKRKKFLTLLIFLIILGVIFGFVAGYFGLFTK